MLLPSTARMGSRHCLFPSCWIIFSNMISYFFILIVPFIFIRGFNHRCGFMDFPPLHQSSTGSFFYMDFLRAMGLLSCSSDEWRNMQRTMKVAKCKYFNNKIESIADHNKRPWYLMSWTRTRKLDSSEAIIFKGEPCLTTEDHWNTFQETFNSAHKWDTYPTCLMQAIHPKPKRA